MPELPEVETIRRQLKEVLIGKKISEVEVLNEKSFVGDKKDILELKIKDVLRKAKVIEVTLEMGFSVLVHLKMTGQLIFQIPLDLPLKKGEKRRVAGGHPSADWVNDLPSKHTRVVVTFEDRSKLFFNDMRKFGWMKVVTRTQETPEEVLGTGENARTQVPDVVDEGFTVEYFAKVLKRSKRAIKLTILDQALMGGVGNIYANDALYLAKVRPDRASNSLDTKETKKLFEAIIEVINKGIECGGASAANYVDTKGLGGTYQDYFLVYKKDGQPCMKCGTKILKMKIGGRGSFYCPKCQK